MESVFPALLLMLAVVFGLSILANLANKAPTPKYDQQQHLLTKAERSFYGVLVIAVQGHYLVFPKVRVADVLKPARGLSRGRWQSAFNRIASKHFDFVLCDPKDLSVKAVLELNDKSHNNTKRATRDRFLVSACESAALAFHQIKASSRYTAEELRRTLIPAAPDNLNHLDAGI